MTSTPSDRRAGVRPPDPRGSTPAATLGSPLDGPPPSPENASSDDGDCHNGHGSSPGPLRVTQ